MPSPSDIVREAARTDSRTAVETWGPEAFARRIRTKIHGFGAPLPPWEDKAARPTPSAKGIPKSVNVILLGPTGSGKSSLIYTWWRALSGSVTGKEEFLADHMHDSVLGRLRVGWNAKDGARCRRKAREASSGQGKSGSGVDGDGGSASTTHGDEEAVTTAGGVLSAAPKHGTTALHAFQLQAPDPNRGTAGIAVHDTKGQQFFTEDEERFAEQMLQGKLKEGSTLDKQNYKYWFMLGNFGFFSTASLAAAPHVVVLVFDVTLRSFEQMLRQREGNDLCQCYRRIVRRAGKQGHEVFAVLTHIDAYSPDDDSDADDEIDEAGRGFDGAGGDEEEAQTSREYSGATEKEGTGFDREVDLPGIVSLWRERLSMALSTEGAAIVPAHNVFAVQNYHRASSAQDPVVDMASLECLESVIDAGARYVDARYQQQQEACTIA